MKATTSISRRLICYLGISLPILWLFTALFSALTVFHEINEAGDTQLSQLARGLLQVPLNPDAPPAVTGLSLTSAQKGLIDADEMGFIVWNRQGQMLVSDQVGLRIPYQGDYQGFINDGAWWQKRAWRTFYLHNEQNGLRVAVSASRRERLKTVRGAIWIQLGVSILSLPLLLALIIWSVRMGTAPLHILVRELNQRNAGSLVAVNSAVPKEMIPVVKALNALLRRIDETLKREQRFTADAAHELRSPLAALKIQTEVLALNVQDEWQQQRLHIIQASIDHITHLINQLLILSKLDPLAAPQYGQPVNWLSSSDQALQHVNVLAKEKHIRLQRLCSTANWSDIFPLKGDDTLMSILLRNLLDNAIRYSPEHSTVILNMAEKHISVENQGNGVAEHHLQRLTERFFRPAGQSESGSGLGLSIVKTIAQLHNMSIELRNKTDQGGHIIGFVVMLKYSA